jgi:hypothetical protein
MGMWLRSFTNFVSQQSDFDLRTGDQKAIGRGMLGHDEFLWNIFELVTGMHCRMRAIDRDLIREGHYGQRSCEPRKQAEHMAAPTNAAYVQESPCQLGAVHTWGKADIPSPFR